MNATPLGRILLGLLLLAITVIAVVQIANIANRIGGDEEENTEDVAQVLSVSDFDNRDSIVRYTAEGPVVGKEDQRQVVITISADKRVIDIYSEYGGKKIYSNSFPNTIDAYRTFLNSLDYEGFDDTKEGTAGTDDERGVCPTGKRYIFELENDNREIFRSWRASCSVKLGTFAGDFTSIKTLFKKQIPDYSKLTRGTNL